jgi:adenylate kinase family enzyme
MFPIVMRAYETSTQPLVDYYARRGLLVSVQADGAPEEIFERATAAVEARQEATARRSP